MQLADIVSTGKKPTVGMLLSMMLISIHREELPSLFVQKMAGFVMISTFDYNIFVK